MGNKLYVGNLPYSVRDNDLEQAFSFLERKMAAKNEWLSSIHQGRLQTDVGREEIQYLRESRQHHLPPLLRPHSC